MPAPSARSQFIYVDAQLWPLPVSATSVPVAITQGPAGVIVVETAELIPKHLPEHAGAERLLDYHWLVYERHSLESRGMVERAFFEVIAESYESAIDRLRNRRCFDELLDRAAVSEGSLVLDFGCGSGVNLRAHERTRFIGCDVSASMRRIAGSEGHRVVDLHGLSAMEGHFDAVVASYVLHLAIPGSDLETAARSLAVGGRFAANFHKGIGLDHVAGVLMRSGMVACPLEEAAEHGQHGVIAVWERRP